MSHFTFEGESIEALPGETVLNALLRSGQSVAYGCKNGSCQSCMIRSLTPPPSRAQVGLADVYVQSRCFLACKCLADQIEQLERVGEDILKKYPAEVVSKDMIGKDVLRLRLKAEGLSVKPGMFVRFISPDGTKRSYSIANNSLSSGDHLEFHIRLLPDGKMSRYLTSRTELNLKLEGPFGSCIYSGQGDQQLIFIGSGTGLAPLYAVLTDALASGHRGKCSLYYGGRCAEDLYFIEELQTLQKHFPQVKVFFCSDAPSDWTIPGNPIDIAVAQERTFTNAKVYTCGHPELVKAVKVKAFLAGANIADIHSDSFDIQN